MRHAHKISQPVSKDSDKVKYHCNICDKEFNTLKESKRHASMSHRPRKPHECTECGRVFQKQYSLKSHYHTAHLNNKDFPCEECGSKFAYKKSLKLHIKSIHLNIKEYNCERCGKWFTQKSHLRRHTCVHGDDCLCKKEENCEPRAYAARNDQIEMRETEGENEEEFETVYLWIKYPESILELSESSSSCHLPVFL